MQTLKKILIGIIALIALVSIGAQFLPDHWSLTRSTLIQAPPKAIYPYLAEIKQWRQWNAFDTMDPAIAYTYSGPAAGVGAQSRWVSKKVGNGTATITAADPAKGISYEIVFEGQPYPAAGGFTFSPEGAATKVDYQFSGRSGRNPAFRILSLLTDRFLGPAFEQSLAALKTVAEKSNAPQTPKK